MDAQSARVTKAGDCNQVDLLYLLAYMLEVLEAILHYFQLYTSDPHKRSFCAFHCTTISRRFILHTGIGTCLIKPANSIVYSSNKVPAAAVQLYLQLNATKITNNLI